MAWGVEVWNAWAGGSAIPCSGNWGAPGLVKWGVSCKPWRESCISRRVSFPLLPVKETTTGLFCKISVITCKNAHFGRSFVWHVRPGGLGWRAGADARTGRGGGFARKLSPEQTDSGNTFPAPVALGPCVGADDLFDGVRLCWLVSCGAGLVGCAGGGAGRDEAML